MNAAIATGEPALHSFVTGLRADQDAVTNGLALSWSSGVVEGHVTCIKMLKRQMYGRANPGCSACACSSPTNPPEKEHGKCARARFQMPFTGERFSSRRRDEKHSPAASSQLGHSAAVSTRKSCDGSTGVCGFDGCDTLACGA